MKVQRNIIYITIIGSIVTIIAYANCIFLWDPIVNSISYKWYTFLSNIMLGIFGSSIVSLIIAFIGYFEVRRKTMEEFIATSNKLFDHCSKYKTTNLSDWFDNYTILCSKLSNCWAEIHFLFDPRRHRLYLKRYVDFYFDLIDVIQDEIRIFCSCKNENLKNTIEEKINNIVFDCECINKGNFKYYKSVNRLTNNSQNIKTNMFYIYQNKKIFKKFVFTHTLITEKYFTILPLEYGKR